MEDIIGENENKLTDDESLKLGGEITFPELTKALKILKNGTFPGNDGFTAEFFKFFWPDIGVYLSKSIDSAYQYESLAVTQKQGIITYLPKPNKSRYF